ncbi:MAG: HAMP domain-containing sensor histidine kinase [Dissulfuribacterales bacterium]
MDVNRLHVLTLVVKRQGDIPKVRMKSKLLCHICGLNRIATTQVAVSASEMSRWMIRMSGTGTVTLSILCCKESAKNNIPATRAQSGIELLFQSKRLCDAANMKDDACPTDMTALNKTPVINGLKKVLDEVDITGETDDSPLEIRAVKWGIHKSWEEIQKKEAFFRNELFRDTEESYMENLRLKHEEVLRLLEQTSLQNHQLDRMNAELLQLSQDMEAMAREHSTIQMALRIADRIRNPVMVIGGLISTILKKDPALTDNTRQKLEVIQKAVQELSDFVKNFEELAAKEIRSFTKDDLKKIISEVITTWQSGLTKKDIKLVTDIPQEPLEIMANKRVLKTAFIHILRNALEASPEHGTIQIKLLRREGRPSIIICDKGPGIPPEIKEKLFTKPVTTKPSGTGLGLFLVKEILEEHQGDILIESEPGQGTCVTCTFPVRWKEKREGKAEDSILP